jgi:hypothetical protein
MIVPVFALKASHVQVILNACLSTVIAGDNRFRELGIWGSRGI